jgi:hypothetical protein
MKNTTAVGLGLSLPFVCHSYLGESFSCFFGFLWMVALERLPLRLVALGTLVALESLPK